LIVRSVQDKKANREGVDSLIRNELFELFVSVASERHIRPPDATAAKTFSRPMARKPDFDQAAFSRNQNPVDARVQLADLRYRESENGAEWFSGAF
jgi:hypothetical protein